MIPPDDVFERALPRVNELLTKDWQRRGVLAYFDGEKEGYYALDGVCTPDTRFEIGSVTKLFTGLLLAEAVTRGDVNLTTPYVDCFKPRRKGSAKATLKALATHTAGLPSIPIPMLPEMALLQMLRCNPYQFASPGRVHWQYILSSISASGYKPYRYSNFSFGLLGEALAAVAGITYAELLQRDILGPLGMTSTDTTRNNVQPGRTRFGPAPLWNLKGFAGAGTIASTARDMIRFLRAVATPDTISPEFHNAVYMATSVKEELPTGAAVGLAWMLSNDRTLPWHNGGTGGFCSFVAVRPEKNRGFVVLLANDGWRQGLQNLVAQALGNALANAKPSPN